MSIEPNEVMPVLCSRCEKFTWEPNEEFGARMCEPCAKEEAAENGMCFRCGVAFDRVNPKARNSGNCLECEFTQHGPFAVAEEYEPQEMAVTDGGESPSIQNALRDAGR